MSIKQDPTTIAHELHALLSRYADIMSAQSAALRDGRVGGAAALARNAEPVLAAARRADRRLNTAQILNPVDVAEWAEIQRKLRTVSSRAETGSNEVGKALAFERTSLLSEMGTLDPNNSNLGTTPPPPALLNIRT